MSAFKQTFFVLRIANAWIAKILKEVKRDKLCFTVNMPTTWLIFNRQQMQPLLELLVPPALLLLQHLREGKAKRFCSTKQPKIHLDLASFHRFQFTILAYICFLVTIYRTENNFLSCCWLSEVKSSYLYLGK